MKASASVAVLFAFTLFVAIHSHAQTPAGDEFQVNSYTSGSQVSPYPSIHSDGHFIILWDDFSGQDGSGYGVFGQRYDSSGTPVGRSSPGGFRRSRPSRPGRAVARGMAGPGKGRGGATARPIRGRDRTPHDGRRSSGSPGAAPRFRRGALHDDSTRSDASV